MPSRVLTIMFTDIQGFTETTSASSRRELRKLLTKHDNLLVPVLERFGGKLVKTIGDALMVIFESPTNAVLCGMMMQETLRKYNDENPDDQKLAIRVAINQGEVEVIGDDVYGEPVNIAARIEGITEPGEIFFTEAVYLSMNKAEVPSSEVDEYRLKGLPESVRVYRVIRDTNSAEYMQRIEKLETEYDAAEKSTAQLARVQTNPNKKFTVGLITVAVIIVLTGGLAAGAFSMGMFATKPTPPPEPTAQELLDKDIAQVQKFLSEEKLPNALTLADQLLSENPGNEKVMEVLQEVIHAELNREISRQGWEDAMGLVEVRANERTWLDTESLKYKVQLAEAMHYMDKDNHFAANQAYNNMMTNFPTRKELWHHIIEQVKTKENPRNYWVAERASYQILDDTEGHLDDFVADTLHKTVHGRSATDTRAEKLRETLKKRDPRFYERLIEDLEHRNVAQRANALRMLAEADKLDELQKATHSLDIMLQTSSVRHDNFVHALQTLESLTKTEEWPALKTAMKTEDFEQVRHLSYPSNHENFAKANQLLMTHFAEELNPFLMKHIYSSARTYIRQNAWKLLHEMKRDDQIDKMKYHRLTIETQNPTINTPAFDDALNYMKALTDPKEIQTALSLLTITLDDFQKIAEKIETNMPTNRDARVMAAGLRRVEKKIEQVNQVIAELNKKTGNSTESSTTQPVG